MTVVGGLWSRLDGMRASLRSRTGRDTQIALSAQVTAAAFGFAGNLILIRVMPVAEYGLFSLFLSALMLFSGFFHFGWIETFARFGARHRGDAAYFAVRALLERRTMGFAVAFACAALLASGWISRSVYQRADFAPYLMVAAVGAVGMTWFSFAQAEQRVRGNFRGYFAALAGSAGIRAAVIAALAVTGALTLSKVASLQVIVPGVFALLMFFARPKSMTTPASWSTNLSPGVRGEILGYNSWLLVSMFSTNLMGNIDSHFIAHYHTNETLSAFGVASRLTLPIFFVVSALTSAILPRLSAARDHSEIRLYVERVIPFLVLAGAGVLLLLWVAPPALVWLAGEKYLGIDALLRMQILTALVMLLTNPFGIVLSALGRAKFLALLNIAQLVIDLALNAWWIPAYGAIGAVAATLVINAVGLLVTAGAVWRVIRK